MPAPPGRAQQAAAAARAAEARRQAAEARRRRTQLERERRAELGARRAELGVEVPEFRSRHVRETPRTRGPQRGVGAGVPPKVTPTTRRESRRIRRSQAAQTALLAAANREIDRATSGAPGIPRHGARTRAAVEILKAHQASLEHGPTGRDPRVDRIIEIAEDRLNRSGYTPPVDPITGAMPPSIGNLIGARVARGEKLTPAEFEQWRQEQGLMTPTRPGRLLGAEAPTAKELAYQNYLAGLARRRELAPGPGAALMKDRPAESLKERRAAQAQREALAENRGGAMDVTTQQALQEAGYSPEQIAANLPEEDRHKTGSPFAIFPDIAGWISDKTTQHVLQPLVDRITGVFSDAVPDQASAMAGAKRLGLAPQATQSEVLQETATAAFTFAGLPAKAATQYAEGLMYMPAAIPMLALHPRETLSGMYETVKWIVTNPVKAIAERPGDVLSLLWGARGGTLGAIGRAGVFAGKGPLARAGAARMGVEDVADLTVGQRAQIAAGANLPTNVARGGWNPVRNGNVTPWRLLPGKSNRTILREMQTALEETEGLLIQGKDPRTAGLEPFPKSMMEAIGGEKILTDTANDAARFFSFHLGFSAYLTGNIIGQTGMYTLAQGARAPSTFARSRLITNQLRQRGPNAHMRILRLEDSQTGAARGGLAQSLRTGGSNIFAFLNDQAATRFYGKILDNGWRRDIYRDGLRRYGGIDSGDKEIKFFNDLLGYNGVAARGRAAEINAQAAFEVREAFGNFDRMTDFERRTLGKYIFVYPWLRTSLEYGLRYPVNHPIKATFLQQAGVYAHDKTRQDFINLFMEEPITEEDGTQRNLTREEAMAATDLIMQRMPGIFLIGDRTINPMSAAVLSMPWEVMNLYGAAAGGDLSLFGERLWEFVNPSVGILFAMGAQLDPQHGKWDWDALGDALLRGVGGFMREVTMLRRAEWAGFPGVTWSQWTGPEAVAGRVVGGLYPQRPDPSGIWQSVLTERRKEEERIKAGLSPEKASWRSLMQDRSAIAAAYQQATGNKNLPRGAVEYMNLISRREASYAAVADRLGDDAYTSSGAETDALKRAKFAASLSVAVQGGVIPESVARRLAEDSKDDFDMAKDRLDGYYARRRGSYDSVRARIDRAGIEIPDFG